MKSLRENLKGKCQGYQKDRAVHPCQMRSSKAEQGLQESQPWTEREAVTWQMLWSSYSAIFTIWRLSGAGIICADTMENYSGIQSTFQAQATSILLQASSLPIYSTTSCTGIWNANWTPVWLPSGFREMSKYSLQGPDPAFQYPDSGFQPCSLPCRLRTITAPNPASLSNITKPS